MRSDKLENTLGKKVIYIDMDDVLCDFTSSYKEAIKKYPRINFPQSQYDFFRKLNPIQNSVRSLKYLDSQNIFDVYILTAPSVKNPLCYTEKRIWVEEHLGIKMVKRLIISPNKGLLKGDYLIDDHEKGRGQENFEGELIKFGIAEFRTWGNVLAYFKKKYNLT